MKKLIVIILSSISIISYADFTDVDRANLALASRSLESIDDISYPFFALDWANLFGTIDTINQDLANISQYSQYLDYIFQDVSSISFNLYDYLPSINSNIYDIYHQLEVELPLISSDVSTLREKVDTISAHTFNIAEDLHSALDTPLSSLKPIDYNAEFDSAISGLTQINDSLSQIQAEGLSVTLNGDPHVTAHIDNLPDFDFDSKDLEDKITDFNDDFDAYVDSFKNQSITIAGSPLWNDLNIENTDDFSLSPEQSRQGTFFQNLQEMISFLHIQNASLNKSAYLIYQEISGKSTEEEQQEYKDSLEKSLDDISKRGEEAKLEIEASQISLNFDSNKDKLKIDSIFQQFPRGEKPTLLYLTIPSFGKFPAQYFQIDISTLGDFLDTARTLVRLTYIIILALLIWSLYRFVFPMFLFFVNFIKKVLTIQ
jgi:hypothetical protein